MGWVHDKKVAIARSLTLSRRSCDLHPWHHFHVVQPDGIRQLKFLLSRCSLLLRLNVSIQGSDKKRPMPGSRNSSRPGATIIRHQSEAPRERSTCGHRYKLISVQDSDAGVAAWAHAVDIEGAKEHYHEQAQRRFPKSRRDGRVISECS